MLNIKRYHGDGGQKTIGPARLVLACLIAVYMTACSTPPPPDIPATVDAQVETPLAAEPRVTPMPTTPSTQTTTSDGFNIADHQRTITIGDLKIGSKFWTDREPFWLLGCHAEAVLGGGDYVFSDNGNFSKASYVAIVNGFFARNEQPKGNCYAMRVKFTGQEDYCFYRSNLEQFHSFRDMNRYICSGWSQVTRRFVMEGSDWAVKISAQEVINAREVK